MLNKKSGVLGISGVSSDFRDLERRRRGGQRACQLWPSRCSSIVCVKK